MSDVVWNIVKGTKPHPRGEEGSAQVRAWDEKKYKALAHIGLGLADNLIHHLDLNKSAKET